MSRKTYKGLQENVRELSFPDIEVWENKYQDKEYIIRFETKEFTCVCPKTGLPDFAELYIEYSPDKYCIELKSFKEYLLEYRDLGIFHEHVTNRLVSDLSKACAPRWLKVKGIFNIRGGITTTVEAEYKREG